MISHLGSSSVPGSIRADVNGREYVIAQDGNGLTLDGDKRNFSLHPLPDGRWYIREGNRGVHVRIINRSADGKSLNIFAKGRMLVVQLRDRLDTLTNRMNLHTVDKSSASRLLAPMPGLIKAVLVTEGRVTSAGESALVLEAMKMENLIRTSASVTIRKILVAPGDRVEKGQPLIEFISQ